MWKRERAWFWPLLYLSSTKKIENIKEEVDVTAIIVYDYSVSQLGVGTSTQLEGFRETRWQIMGLLSPMGNLPLSLGLGTESCFPRPEDWVSSWGQGCVCLCMCTLAQAPSSLHPPTPALSLGPSLSSRQLLHLLSSSLFSSRFLPSILPLPYQRRRSRTFGEVRNAPLLTFILISSPFFSISWTREAMRVFPSHTAELRPNSTSPAPKPLNPSKFPGSWWKIPLLFLKMGLAWWYFWISDNPERSEARTRSACGTRDQRLLSIYTMC